MSGFAYRITPEGAVKVAVAEALTEGAALSWIHLSVTKEDAQAWLNEEARLPPHIVEALTAAETRPRCEAFQEGALINLRGRSKDGGADLLSSVRLWATHGRVFSVSRAHLIATDAVEDMAKHAQVNDPGDLIAAFASAITADLDPVVAELGDSLDTCEEQLASDRIFELRRAVTQVRVAAIAYRRFLNPQRAALEKLAGLPGDWLQDDDRLHLNAAADRAARMAEELESIRERSAVMHETLTDLRAEQIDARGLVLSAAALVFLPLTFITGLYGMNVKGLWGAENPYAFDWIVAVCAAISLGVITWFVWRRWLRGG